MVLAPWPPITSYLPSEEAFRRNEEAALVRQSDGDAHEILRQLAAVSLDQDGHLNDLQKLHCFTLQNKFYSILQTIRD